MIFPQVIWLTLASHLVTGVPLPPSPLQAGTHKYRLAVVADPDKAGKRGEEWVSFFREGELLIQGDSVEVSWGQEQEISNNLAAGGRAMELSELIMFEENLLAMDDKTGVVYKLLKEWPGVIVPVPWVILSNGPGNRTRGFKAEWSTVVGERLVVGSQGTEWRSKSGGDVMHRDRMWVKMISSEGAVTHHNWTDSFLAVSEAAGISSPGYLVHEAVCWSDLRREWTFLPRRMSHSGYDPLTEESLGANIMVIADENFTTLRTITLGDSSPGRGFSSCKFLPGTEERLLVGLRTEEEGERLESFVTVFSVEGEVLLSDTKIGDRKYEGVEIIGTVQYIEVEDPVNDNIIDDGEVDV